MIDMKESTVSEYEIQTSGEESVEFLHEEGKRKANTDMFMWP